MPKTTVIDPAKREPRTSSPYPRQFHHVVEGREKVALGNEAGLTAIGVNLTRLPPGAATALRHYHTREDELVFVVTGTVILVNDDGEQPLGPGMAAAFPAGEPNGHHLINRGEETAVLVEVGARDSTDEVYYPDVDLHCRRTVDGKLQFTHKDGRPYEE